MTTGQKLAAGHLCTLFHLGTIGDLSDQELLERFVTALGEPADLAFTALLHRHAPMVLRVCAALLHDPHDAQDALQATFLVLLRKSRDLWVHDSLGPWLHRVARRTAQRAQALARRRRECERTAAESRTLASLVDHPGHDAPNSILHEEIDRLPDPLRVLVILCHLEGQSQALAAKTLSLPVGTVKSRLHRARSLLRTRLSRRGVACSPVLLSPEPPSRPDHAIHSLPLCSSMLHAAAHAGLTRSTGDTFVSARAVQLFEETIKTMFLTRMKIAAALVLLAGCIALGASGVFAQQERRNGAQPATESTSYVTAATAAAGQGAAGRRSAPAFVRASRKMIVERLEEELKRTEGQLANVTARTRSPENDAIALHLRKTVTKLAGLLDRIDTVLAQAVDEFPTIFNFANEERDQQKTSIDEELARGADRVDWAKRMFEKGYIAKHQYEAEILKHYGTLKARAQAQPQSVSDAWQREVEKMIRELDKLLKQPASKTQPGEPAAKPGTDLDDSTNEEAQRARAKLPPAADTAPAVGDNEPRDRAKLPPGADTAPTAEAAPGNDSVSPF